MSVALPLIKREMRLALSAGGGAGLSLAFFLVTIMLIPFGVGPAGEVLRQIAPGLIWVATLLATLLSLDRMIAQDAEDGTLDILALSPIPLEGLVALKILAHWLTTGLPMVVIAPLLGITLNLAPQGYLWLIISLAIGTPALSALGAIGATLTMGLRRGGLLLSILVLPLFIPTLIFGAQTVVRASEGFDPLSAVLLLAAVTLLSLAAAPIAAAAAIRVHLR